MSRTQTYFQNTNLSGFTVAQIKQYGELLSLEPKNIGNIKDLAQYHQVYLAQHAPTFGNAIPVTSKIAQKTATDDNNQVLLTATGQEVYEVQAITITHAGGSPAEVEILVGTFVLLKSAANPSGDTVFTLPYKFTIDANLDLGFKVTSGTATDITAKALVCKVVQ
mgnify:CR=1 FL=1|tara:strand:- start:13 stop:507 length:495 start_codon:yes stop_codon:yes gene_type:complete